MKQEPPLFAEFWACWRPFMRHSDGRGKARGPYHKQILAGADPQEILDGAKAYLRNLSERDRPYIPLASSWLHAESYADWFEIERKYQAQLAAAANRTENVVSIRAATGQTAFLKEWNAKQKEA